MNREPEAWARLGRALREARGHAGMTQAELADQAGVSTAAVGTGEQGKVPERRMPPSLPKIARALGWPSGTIEAILDGADPPGGWGVGMASGGQVDSQLFETVMTKAMVAATNNATASEIRDAVRIAARELRRHGALSPPDDVQPKATK